MPVPKKQTSLLAWLFLVLVVVVGIAMLTGAATSSSGVAAAAPEDPCKLHAFGYLLALKEGNSIAAGYWKPGLSSATLFAVRNFDEVKSGEFVQPNGKPYKVPRRYSQFTVESSTRGGFAITKRWNVILEPSAKNYGGQPCAIVDLKEAQ